MTKLTILGRTNLKISTIAFGGIPIQRSDEKNTIEIIDKLEQLGINYIDTARGYTVSEKYLGVALKSKRDKFVLATKSMSRNYVDMKKDLEISFENLQTNYIDIYQLHNVKPNDFETIFSKNGAYNALLDAKKNGEIGYIGITLHSLDSFEIMLLKYSDKFDTVMFPFNIVELQGYDLLKKAKSLNIGTIAMKPLAGGNISNYELALKFIAKNDCCDIAIIGMGDVLEVDKNATIWGDVSDFTKEENKEILKIRNDLGTAFCRRCGYCQPCTKGIDITTQFLLFNYFKNYKGLKKWAIERFETLEINSKHCIKCKICETRCPYNLPITKMLDEVTLAFNI